MLLKVFLRFLTCPSSFFGSRRRSQANFKAKVRIRRSAQANRQDRQCRHCRLSLHPPASAIATAAAAAFAAAGVTGVVAARCYRSPKRRETDGLGLAAPAFAVASGYRSQAPLQSLESGLSPLAAGGHSRPHWRWRWRNSFCSAAALLSSSSF